MCIGVWLPSMSGCLLHEYDRYFTYPIANPTYFAPQGPVVIVDEGHNNYQRIDNLYKPFADLLRRDGYQVRSSQSPLTPTLLNQADILVIVNPLPTLARLGSTTLIQPAYTHEEATILLEWVIGGGSLLLVVDHIPFPAAAASIAQPFGIEFTDGYALQWQPDVGITSYPDLFDRARGGLVDHPITRGRTPTAVINSVATFRGQAFRATGNYQPLLIFDDTFISIDASNFWQVPLTSNLAPNAGALQINGWLQGAVSEFGIGKVAVFGEAAMFSAQRVGKAKAPMGMNHPKATQNAQLLLNVMQWLTGRLTEPPA